MVYPPIPLLLFIASAAGQEIDRKFMEMLLVREEKEHDLSV